MITEGELKAIITGIGPVLRERFSALDQRVTALEARPPGCEWKGVFVEDGTVYEPGSLVTRSGSLWLCLTRTAAIPGSSPVHWKLIVKSGHAER